MKSFVTRALVVATGAAMAVPMFLWVSPAGAVGAPAAVTTSSITGAPAHFSPASIKATAKLPTGDACAAKYASFEFINKESVAEKFTLSGTGLGSGSGSVPKGYGEYICVPKGYTGTVHVKLTDKKELTVKF
jgi:hypothetical protein